MSKSGHADIGIANLRPTPKGWCPGAYRPMMSGDGLIVRVRPRLGRLDRSQALGLCDAARRFGSGILELTNRGNLQLRGLREAQYPQVLTALADLDLIDPDPALEERRNIVVTPLWRTGDDSERVAGELAARLRELPPLPAKFGFAVDAGQAPVLAGVSADIRIERASAGGLIVRAEGSDKGISVEPATSVDVAITLATWFAATANHTRMKAHLAGHALPDALVGTEVPARQAPLPLPGPTMLGPVYGVAFGQMTATALEGLLHECAAGALRVSPNRTIVLEHACWSDSAEFLTTPDDPLLQIDACPGAPACASATVETRTLARTIAPLFARSAAQDTLRSVHVAGCAKGCARSRPADLTLVGSAGCFDVVRNGAAWDPPSCTGILPDALPAFFGAE